MISIALFYDDGGGDDDDDDDWDNEMMMKKTDYYDIDPGYVNCLPSFTGIGLLIVSSCLRQILSHGFHNINSKPSGSGSWSESSENPENFWNKDIIRVFTN